MASKKPGSFQQAEPAEPNHHLEEDLQEFASTLLSMENMDRSSPELWPDMVPDLPEFRNKFQSTPNSATKLPYSKQLSREDQNYMHQLAAMPTSSLLAKVKELQDMAYQLGVEEAKEVTRGKYLNLFNKDRKK